MRLRDIVMRRRGLVSWAGVVLFFAGAGLLFTYPMVFRLADTVPQDLGDPLLVTWILGWNFKQFSEGFNDYFSANILYPTKKTFLFSDTMVGIAAVGFPLYLVTDNLVTVYNLLFWLSFPLAGIAMAVLCYQRTRHIPASLIGGFIFAFVPFRFDHLAHLQLQWLIWIPLWPAFAERFLATGRARYVLLALLVLVLQGFSTVYYLLFLLVIAGILVAVSFFSGQPVRRKRAGVLAGSILLGLLILSPYLRLYPSVREEYQLARQPAADKRVAVTPFSYLAAPWCNRLYHGVTKRLSQHETNLLVGAVPALLAFLGLGFARFGSAGAEPQAGSTGKFFPVAQKILSRVFLAWAIITLLVLFSTYLSRTGGWDIHIGSLHVSAYDRCKLTLQWDLAVAGFLVVSPWARARIAGWWKRSSELDRSMVLIGTVGFLLAQNYVLYFVGQILVPFQLIRSSGRWGLLVMLCLAYHASLGTDRLLSRLRNPVSKIGVPALLCVLIGIEYFSGPMYLRDVPTEETIDPAYHWLREQDEIRVVAELPMDRTGDNTWYQYHSTFHWKNLVNGYTGYRPPYYWPFMEDMHDFPSPKSLKHLQDRGTDVVILHGDRMSRSEFAQKRAGLQQIDAFRVVWEQDKTVVVQVPKEELSGVNLEVRLMAEGYDYGLSDMDVSVEGEAFRCRGSTDPQGRVQFAFLPPGPYAVRAASGDVERASQEVVLGRRGAQTTIRVPVTSPGTGALVLRTADQLSGEPVRRVRINLSRNGATVKDDWDRTSLFIAPYLDPGEYTIMAVPLSKQHTPTRMKVQIGTDPLITQIPIPPKR